MVLGWLGLAFVVIGYCGHEKKRTFHEAESVIFGRMAINQIDQTILSLLNERARYAREIAVCKREFNVPIEQPDRETEVLRRVRERSVDGILGPDGVERIFRQIIEEMKVIEGSK